MAKRREQSRGGLVQIILTIKEGSMRLEKIKENEEVKCDYLPDYTEYGEYSFLDFINCGECYLLTRWTNEEEVTVTLNKDTVLEDLHEKHGGSIDYRKFCSKTFHLYESMDRDVRDENLDEVINYTKIKAFDWFSDVLLLKTLITGVGWEELDMTTCIVRWANEGSSRGEDWYRLLED